MRVCPECQRCYDDNVDYCTESEHPELSQMRDGDREMIAGYHLGSLISSTGKTDLYRAIEATSGRSCLIRIVDADEENLDQLVHEAQSAAAFFHPNVATIYEIGGLTGGDRFIVSEDPEGTTLQDLFYAGGAPSLLTAIRIARQTAEALYALHQNGLIHRAVNPANIVIATGTARDVQVKLQDLDFGGVRERSIAADKFVSGDGLYSLKYFAPEQCSGEASSPQTDVYGLGVVLYEMLAGAPPFEGTWAAALINAHRHQPPPEIKIANFGLRMLLSHTLTEALHKSPASRQSSANAVARQLRHIEQLETHTSTPPPAGYAPLGQLNNRSASVRTSERASYFASTEPAAVKVEGHALGGRVLPFTKTDGEIGSSLPAPEMFVPPPVETLTEVHVSETEPEVFKATATRVEPKKIAWEQPEDDIPSEDDVMQALYEEQVFEPVEYVADMSAEQPIEMPQEPLPEFVITEPEPFIEIQAELPLIESEDKPPTAVRAKNASVVTVIQRVITPPLPAAPSDDLHVGPKPSRRKRRANKHKKHAVEVADNSIVLTAGPIAEETIASTPPRSRIKQLKKRLRRIVTEHPQLELFPHVEEVGVKIGTLDARKIEWETPDDDIPSFEDVMEVMASENIVGITTEPAEEKEPELATPADDTPLAVNIIEPLEREAVAMVPAEPDEITLVRGNRITIDVDHPLPTPTFYDYDRFVPHASYEYGSRLAVTNERKGLAPRPRRLSRPIISAYNTPRRSRFRGVVVSGCLVAVVGVFVLFGNNKYIRELFPNMAQDQPVAAKSANPSMPVRSQPIQPSAVTRANKTVVKAPEKIVPAVADGSDRDAAALKPSPSKTNVPATVAARSSSSPTVTKAAATPSTRVIYSENGKVKSTTIPDSRRADKHPRSAKDLEAISTRPRVVKNK